MDFLPICLFVHFLDNWPACILATCILICPLPMCMLCTSYIFGLLAYLPTVHILPICMFVHFPVHLYSSFLCTRYLPFFARLCTCLLAEYTIFYLPTLTYSSPLNTTCKLACLPASKQLFANFFERFAIYVLAFCLLLLASLHYLPSCLYLPTVYLPSAYLFLPRFLQLTFLNYLHVVAF